MVQGQMSARIARFVVATPARGRPSIALIAVGFLLSLSTSGSGGQASEVYGVWVTDDGRGAVRIAPCGGAACGHVIWLRDRTRLDGGPLVDVLNPDPKRRSRSICGIQVIGAVKRQSDGSWNRGWVYDPKVGKTYNVALSLEGPDRLAVRGYLQTKVIGRTNYWTRAPAGLRKCR